MDPEISNILRSGGSEDSIYQRLLERGVSEDEIQGIMELGLFPQEEATLDAESEFQQGRRDTPDAEGRYVNNGRSYVASNGFEHLGVLGNRLGGAYEQKNINERRAEIAREQVKQRIAAARLGMNGGAGPGPGLETMDDGLEAYQPPPVTQPGAAQTMGAPEPPGPGPMVGRPVPPQVPGSSSPRAAALRSGAYADDGLRGYSPPPIAAPAPPVAQDIPAPAAYDDYPYGEDAPTPKGLAQGRVGSGGMTGDSILAEALKLFGHSNPDSRRGGSPSSGGRVASNRAALLRGY